VQDVPLDPQAQRQLVAASGLSELGLYQEAVDELESLPVEIKETTVVLASWLELYQHWHKWAEALAVAQRLTELEPDEPNWAIALAYATRRVCGLGLAREVLQSAVEKFENCAAIHFNLACYAAQLGELDEAKVRLTRAIELDREFASLAKTDPDLAPIRSEDRPA
jgi:lipopolysaccharide biosynthesis regulator YciM